MYSWDQSRNNTYINHTYNQQLIKFTRSQLKSWCPCYERYQACSDYFCGDTPQYSQTKLAGVLSLHLNIHEKYNFPS